MEDRKYTAVYISDEDAELLEELAELDNTDQAVIVHTLLEWYREFYKFIDKVAEINEKRNAD